MIPTTTSEASRTHLDQCRFQQAALANVAIFSTPGDL